MERGKADIAGCVKYVSQSDGSGSWSPGFSFVIEVKMPRGKLETHQRDWLKDYVHRGGGRAAVCRSSAEALEFVNGVRTSSAARWRGEILAEEAS